ncbi:hypothetical protein ACT691_17100 [Vibrio metschnikovii]
MLMDLNNPAVGKEWDGVDIDPTPGFKGHFGALATYKERYDVKNLDLDWRMGGNGWSFCR